MKRGGWLAALAVVAFFTVAADACVGPSGVPMPTGDVTSSGHTWHPLYADDFSATVPLGSYGPDTPLWEMYGYHWSADHEYPDPGGNAYYAPLKVISLHDGQMDLWFHTDPSNGRHYLATVMSKTNQLYGRFSLRMKGDGVMPGYHVTPLLWPASGVWPRDGEVDFPDVWLDSAGAQVSAFMHHQNGTSGGDQDYFPSGTTAYNWHTWTMEWAPTFVRFYVDGQLFGTSTTRIPNTPMHWVLQFDSYPDHPISSSTQGHVLIDWAVAHSY